MRIFGIKKLSPIILAPLLIVLLSSGLLDAIIPNSTSVAYAATLKGDELKGKVVTNSGKPVSGAQVQLISPANTMMDVTTTDGGGKFTLDLGVLEDSEMEKLDRFTVVVNKGGEKIKKGLDSGVTSANDVVNVENITLP